MDLIEVVDVVIPGGLKHCAVVSPQFIGGHIVLLLPQHQLRHIR